MKRLLLLSLLICSPLATINVPAVRAQTTTVAPDRAVTADAKREIQDATDQLMAALRRGDAAGALRWLAPDFRLGERQYRVRDLAWMQAALPLQLERGRYIALSTKVTEVEWHDGIAMTDERINADIEAKKGVRTASGLEQWGVGGAGHAEWISTAQGWRLRKANSTLDALTYLAAPSAPLTPQSAANPEETAAIVGLSVQEPAAVIERVNGQFERALAWTPDGTALAFNPDYRANLIAFASAQTGETLRQIAGESFALAIPKGQSDHLWTAGNGKVRRLNSANGTVLNQWEAVPENRPWTFSVAPTGQTFAVSKNNETRLWNAQTGEQSEPLRSAYGNFIRAEFSPDGTHLALISHEGIEIRSASNGALVQTIPNDKWGGFLGDGQKIATMKFVGQPLGGVREGETLRFRDVKTGAVEREIAIPQPVSRQLKKLSDQMDAGGSVRASGYFQLPLPTISPDGTRAASVYYDGNIGIWDTKTGEITRMLRGFSSELVGDRPDVLFSPDGQKLAVNSGRGEIAVWDVATP